MLSSDMKLGHQSLIRVHDCCVRRRSQFLEADDTITDEYTKRLVVYFYLIIFALNFFTSFDFNSSKRFSVLMFHTLSQFALNIFPKLLRLGASRTQHQTLSSSSESSKCESGWSPIFPIFIRSLGFELSDVAVIVAKIQYFFRLSYLKIESISHPRRLLEEIKSLFKKIPHTCSLVPFLGLMGIKHRKSVACEIALVSWRYSPRIWTWPWLGSLLSYTRDPLGFIQKHARSKGDVFTTTILGYNCTFIQSSEYIQSFSTATRKVLDVTAAYKLVAAPLIGEEAFFGQTKYMNQVVLSKSRIDQLHDRLWELAEELIEIKWSQCLPSGHTTSGTENWQKIDVAQLLDYVIFGLDMFVLIGEEMVHVNLDRISHLLRVIDSDLSLLGILLPMIKGGRCPRKEAKNELLAFLKRDVRRRVEAQVQRAVNLANGLCDVDSVDNWHDHPEEQPQQELPDLLLCSELKDLDESIMLDYHRGEQSAIDAINEKVEFVALFIYGFVWAAQTNSAAATIGLVYDILYHDQPHLSSRECGGAGHVDRIRQECASALLKEDRTRAPLYEDMPHLTYCLNETLRLRATGAWIRLAEKPFHLTPQASNKLPSVICPPGFIVLSPMSVSLNPSIYPNPKRWDPFRYQHAPFVSAESGDDPARHIPLHKTYLIPPARPSNPYFASWGLGQGHCPGKHLACKMISMTVARFFEKFEARPVEDKFENAKFEDIAAAGVQRLKNGFTLLVRKRSPSGAKFIPNCEEKKSDP